MTALYDHLKQLYPTEFDTPEEHLPIAAAAIELMKNDMRREELRYSGGRISLACEVIAQFELEGFLAA